MVSDRFRLTSQLAVLQEIANDYPGKTIDNIIKQMEQGLTKLLNKKQFRTMDKKKVKVHVENVSKILGTKRQTLSAGNLEHLQNELKLALIELSKSDWVSVEDKQPPKNVVVQVCNKQEPDDLILAYRTNHGTMKIVYPGNVAICRITHWKPIEKLDKIK